MGDPDHTKASFSVSIYNQSALPQTHRSHPFAETLCHLHIMFNNNHKYKCLTNIRVSVDIHMHKGHYSDFQMPSWNYCPCFNYAAKDFYNPVVIIIIMIMMVMMIMRMMMMKKYSWS